ncbi:four helix bundle protein [Patescibacteria group bacterium]|nr:four helix bundle protein [Patescibacteria group bacterium]
MKLLELIECVLQAPITPERGRMEVLIRASGLLDLVKLQIRLGYDVQALNEKSYLVLQSKLQEIGKMLGGWIKKYN